MSKLVAAAEAVKDQLNAATFSLAFVAERNYADYQMELKKDDTATHVDVVPIAVAAVDLADRNHVEMDLPVDIGIRQRVAADPDQGRIDNAKLDPLLALLEEIAVFFMRKQITIDGITWLATEVRASHDFELLMQTGQFTGIVRVTFEDYDQLP